MANKIYFAQLLAFLSLQLIFYPTMNRKIIEIIIE